LKSETDKRVDAAWDAGFEVGEEDGATLERRRIRALQREALKTLRAVRDGLAIDAGRMALTVLVVTLDRATRARRVKR
jgi:hypothetical protein